MFAYDAHLTGALNELRVQTHYTRNGWDVFTPIHNKTRADFIAVKQEIVIRVQVKTAQYNNGYIQSRLDIGGTTYTKEDCDVIAFVLDERLWIAPVEQVEGYTSINLGKVDTDGRYTPRKEYDPNDWVIENFH